MSLLHAVGNPIKLDIYLDKDGYAVGDLYMDDGETFAYRDEFAITYVRYYFENNVLTEEFVTDKHRWYDGAFNQKIDTVVIHGIEKAPEQVVIKHTGAQAKFEYKEDLKSVIISDLPFTVIMPGDPTAGNATDMLELVYSPDLFLTAE